jgi:hypothetical protein
MSELIFKNWKQRCSSLGHILTNLPQPITELEGDELANLIYECKHGLNANGNKTKWTDVKANRTKRFKEKKKARMNCLLE